MSIIRWSENDGRCDIYVYNHVNDLFCLMIAGRRLREEHREEYERNQDEMFGENFRPEDYKPTPDEWFEPVEPFGEMTFFFEDHETLGSFLLWLKRHTELVIPDVVFERLATPGGTVDMSDILELYSAWYRTRPLWWRVWNRIRWICGGQDRFERHFFTDEEREKIREWRNR